MLFASEETQATEFHTMIDAARFSSDKHGSPNPAVAVLERLNESFGDDEIEG